LRIAVAKEIVEGERRVALVPTTVAQLVNAGFEVWVEKGAGEKSFFPDTSYEEAGAKVIADAEKLWRESDVLLKVRAPYKRENRNEVEMLHEGSVLIGFLNPFGNPTLIKEIAEKKITSFSLELMPRISRAQSMDALTSQASIAGYKAAIIGADTLGKFFPMLTTAAGTIAPAKVLVIGAGVAGLQAIATARRLGALVEAFDIRPEVKEEVESLGAKFLMVELEEETTAEGGYAKEVSEEAKRREREMLIEHVRQSDVVITTALVPGKKAPLLLTKEMVEGMKPGSVIVDMAAEQGGNCELTKAGKEVVYNDVTIVGPVNLPSSMPIHASQMYSKNISTFLLHLTKDGKLNLDFSDDIINSTCLTHEGIIRNEKVREAVERER
jgi:NAD(P) transhydrogenase subunit alpha